MDSRDSFSGRGLGRETPKLPTQPRAPAKLPAGGETESGGTSGCPSKEQVSIPVCPPLQGGRDFNNSLHEITSMSAATCSGLS